MAPPADFLISVPKVKILKGVRIDTICPNLPIRSKISVNKKSWYTQFKDNLVLIIFYQKTWVVWALLLQLCVVKVTDDVIAKKLHISSQNCGNLCLYCPNKLNSESIIDRGRSKSLSLLKMAPQKLSEAAPRTVLWKRCSENVL